MTWANLVDFWALLFGSCAALLFLGCVCDELRDRRRGATAAEAWPVHAPGVVDEVRPAAFIPPPRAPGMAPMRSDNARDA